MKSDHIQMEIKEVSEMGTFEGMLSPYNVLDNGGDIVEPGAYTKTLKERGTKVPLLWQHDHKNPIGELMLEDRSEGLWAKGRLLMSLPQAKAAYECIKAKIVSGMSIGFQTIKEEVKNDGRHLREIKLYEGSVVTFPMQELAQIMTVKAGRTKRVDGVDLPASAFAYVGDPDRPETWKLPIQFPSSDQSKAHVRNALARFNQTQGIPAAERATVLARLRSAALKYGVGEGSNKADRKDFNDEFAQTQTLGMYWQMFSSLQEAIAEIRDDDQLSREEKIAECDASLGQFASRFGDFFPDYLDARDSMMNTMQMYSAIVGETKAGAMISAANAQMINSACDKIMSGHNEIKALVGGKAVDSDTLAAKAADDEPTEPADDHSDLQALLEEIGTTLTE